jgi:hypothetical protein
MFFDKNNLDDALLCQQCEGRLDVPKILSCGKTICSFCVSSLIVNENKFDCLLCKQKHEMPINGLPNNEALLKILSVKPRRVSRGKLFDSLQKSLNDIQKKHNFIKLGIENSNDLVKEHCIDLRSDVQLKAEEVILQVNDASEKIIKEINEYEKELIKFNKTNSKSFDDFKSIVNELESFHTVNIEYLKQYEVDDTLLVKLNEDAANLMNKVESEVNNLKDIIFDGKFLVFEKNKEKIMKSILGFTKIDKIIDSEILLNKTQIKELLSLCEFPVDQKWNLIYRASQDGFKAANFHSKCDNKPNTLVIVKSQNGNVFGGYTEQSWTGERDNLYKADPKSFIFSLINNDKKPLKINWSQNEGIYCRKLIGPTFGGGPDIRIEDESNKYTNSSSNLGHSYIHPDYPKGSKEANSFLAGSSNFQVDEIEVFTKN